MSNRLPVDGGERSVTSCRTLSLLLVYYFFFFFSVCLCTQEDIRVHNHVAAVAAAAGARHRPVDEKGGGGGVFSQTVVAAAPRKSCGMDVRTHMRAHKMCVRINTLIPSDCSCVQAHKNSFYSVYESALVDIS